MTGAVLIGACVWSFWWPTRTFVDDRKILEGMHIDYGMGLAENGPASGSRYELRFLRTSNDTLRVDFQAHVTNQRPKPLKTICYYLVPPGSELLDTSQIDP